MAEKKKQEKRRVLVDFDGVLSDFHSGPGKDPKTDLGKPLPGAIEFLRELITEFDVYIWSARFAIDFDRQTNLVSEWLRKAGMIDEELDFIGLTAVKLPARIYIDDRAFHFKGKYPTMDFIRSFKSWLAE